MRRFLIRMAVVAVVLAMVLLMDGMAEGALSWVAGLCLLPLGAVAAARLYRASEAGPRRTRHSGQPGRAASPQRLPPRHGRAA